MSKGFDIRSNKHLGNSHDYWKSTQRIDATFTENRECEDSNFVSCVSCEFQDDCCSKQFGLGCNKGKISK